MKAFECIDASNLKGKNMKNLSLLFVLAGFMLTGCNQYTQSICSESARFDFADFAGNYRVEMPQQDGTVAAQFISFKRLDQGVYADQTGKKALVCKFGNKTLIEFPVDPAQGGDVKNNESYLITPSSDGYDLAFMAFNKKELDAKGIKYIEVKQDGVSMGGPQIVVQNDGMSNEVVAQLLNRTSIKIAMYRE